MSEASRDTINIPTSGPTTVKKTRKTSMQTEEGNFTDDSTDVWYDNIVQKYEKRPIESILLSSAEMHSLLLHYVQCPYVAFDLKRRFYVFSISLRIAYKNTLPLRTISAGSD
jgi:hypothetical protein